MSYADFVADPLASWIESTFGVEPDPETGRLVRAKPSSITGRRRRGGRTRKLTGVPEDVCAKRIAGSARWAPTAVRDPETGFPVFAFRLHQFISRGETVYASLEPEDRREISLYGQQFVPGERDRVLLPLVFCRECGQEYYVAVTSGQGSLDGLTYAPRQLSDRLAGADAASGGPEAGFLYINSAKPWPDDTQDVLERLPDDWLEVGAARRVQAAEGPSQVSASGDPHRPRRP